MLSSVGRKRAHSFSLDSNDNDGFDFAEISGPIFRDDDGSPDLLALYSGDLSERMLSFASGSDLCQLDAVNKRFKDLTAAKWKLVTYERFGMKNGKDGWRMGLSFMRKPIVIDHVVTPEEGLMDYGKSDYVTTYNSLIAVNRPSDKDWNSRLRCGAPGVNLYDAEILVRVPSRQEQGCKTVMAGPTGNELFITNEGNVLKISHRENDFVQRHVFYFEEDDIDIKVIGNQTHVIVVVGNTIHLNKLSFSAHENTFVGWCHSVRLVEDRRNHDEMIYPTSIAWGQDQSSEFVISYFSKKYEMEISVWNLETEADVITRTQTIFHADERVDQVVLTDDYIIGNTLWGNIFIWDRKTGEKMRRGFPLFEDHEFGNYYRLSTYMSCHGHILVSTSHISECALCVWNIKTGQLLKKWSDPDIDKSSSSTVTRSMTYWKHQNLVLGRKY
jgi:hypothetical protein